MGARRPAGIGVGLKRLAAFALGIVADGKVAAQQVDLFPIGMNEWFSGEDAGMETQKPRAAAVPVILIEGTGKNLLLDAVRITGRHSQPADRSRL